VQAFVFLRVGDEGHETLLKPMPTHWLIFCRRTPRTELYHIRTCYDQKLEQNRKREAFAYERD
jgi:hypothetical protein